MFRNLAPRVVLGLVVSIPNWCSARPADSAPESRARWIVTGEIFAADHENAEANLDVTGVQIAIGLSESGLETGFTATYYGDFVADKIGQLGWRFGSTVHVRSLSLSPSFGIGWSWGSIVRDDSSILPLHDLGDEIEIHLRATPTLFYSLQILPYTHFPLGVALIGGANKYENYIGIGISARVE